MERIIKVTGKGKIFLKPDTTVLKIDIVNKNTSYEEILRKTNQDLKSIKDLLIELNFLDEQIKTTYFKIDIDNESYRDEFGVYKTRFVGYKSLQKIKLSFENNNKLLGDILSALAKLDLKLSISIEYIIKNQEQVKNELLSSAIKDASKKGQIIASNSHVQLGEIINVDYSFSNNELFNPVVESQFLKSVSEKSNYNLDLTPDDIELEDSIVIVFAIK